MVLNKFCKTICKLFITNSAYFICLYFYFINIYSSYAAWTSPHIAHPLNAMHQVPSGEAPGWNTKNWLNVEHSIANIWSTPLVLTNLENGKLLQYQADFQQATTTLEWGGELLPSVALSAETSWIQRVGGDTDTFIDDFHQAIGSNRFQRQYYLRNQSVMDIQTDNISHLNSHPGSGLSNALIKLKFWPIQWAGPSGNNSAGGGSSSFSGGSWGRGAALGTCGLGATFGVKVPLSDSRTGLSSGGIDYINMYHAGLPLGRIYLGNNTAFFLTAGFMTLGKNPVLDAWPRRRHIEFYDASLDFLIGRPWGNSSASSGNSSGGGGGDSGSPSASRPGSAPGLHLLLQTQIASPFMEISSLKILSPDPSDTNPDFINARIGTAWNSLALWRAYESLGLMYRLRSGGQLALIFTEDIGLHAYDEDGKVTYTTNAPDVQVGLQMSTSF